jgi:hypothetical protein
LVVIARRLRLVPRPSTVLPDEVDEQNHDQGEEEDRDVRDRMKEKIHARG